MLFWPLLESAILQIMKAPLRNIIVLTLVGLLLAPAIFAVRIHAKGLPTRILRSTPRDVVSDFDGDRNPDESRLSSSGFEKTIDVRFGNLRRSQLHFTSQVSDRGSLYAIDIDHDGDVDLVWVARSQQRNDVVWLNDGKGNFQAAKDDSPYCAAIEAVSAANGSEDESSISGNASPRNLIGSTRADWAPGIVTLPSANLLSSRIEFLDNQPQHNSIHRSCLHKRGPPTHIL